MRLRYKIYLVVSILAGVFLWGRCSRTNIYTVPVPTTVLPQNDKEQIIVDPTHHKLTVVTQSGPKIVTLPDKPSVIDIHKDGSVKVTSPQFGLERKPFVGFAQSDYFRGVLGLDLLYWKKLDLGIGIGTTTHLDQWVGFVKVSYNIWDNLQMGVSIDNRKNPGVFIAVRI